MQFQKPSDRCFKHPHGRLQLNPAGNVLIYVVVLMLIFGVLGVVMVSLFTSTTSSTVTRNDSRRARFMAESGMRYSFSEMRSADFDLNHMLNTLNTITYQVSGTESFNINVFSPWMDSSKTQSSPPDGPLTLLVPIGTIPTGYIMPPNNIYAINYEFTGTTPTEPGGVAEVSSVAGQTPTTLDLNLTLTFNAGEGERVAFAVKPTENRVLTDGGDLYIAPEAIGLFPRFGGAFSIGRDDYFYEELIDDTANNRVILRNLSKRPEDVFIAATTSDYVILSPRNYLVVPTGTSEGTVYGGDYLFGKGIYDASLVQAGSSKPDITAEDFVTNLSEQETDTRFFEKNLVDYELEIGGGQTNEFGSAFFDANMSIGGDQNYCAQGACLFNIGVRVFFLMNFNQQGDGITFTLTNAATNTATSVGGDVDLSELMGYGGDGRTDSGGTTFVASDVNDRGLDPPKIAVEFDTRTNNRPDDPPPDYCAGPNVETNLRNDPLVSNKDAVQYVFWGRESFLDIPCRGDSPLYDDNRHDAVGEDPKEEWRFEGASAQYSVWRPAIGPDGTAYVSALDATLYALNEDGSVKWTFNLTDSNQYMPGVDPDSGTIYSDITGNKLVAINPDGTFKWDFYMDSDVDSTPVVGPDGTIYFGTDGTAFALFALNPDGSEKWNFPTGWEVDNVPALNSDASEVYFVATDPDTLNNDGLLYAVRTSDGLELWRFPLVAENNELTSSPTVDTKGTADPSDDVIYVGDDDWYVYALRSAVRLTDPNPVAPFPLGANEWRFRTNGEIESSAAVDPDDGTIYIGSDDGRVWAINPNGTAKWRFLTRANVESSPIVDVDGTVYIGSLDDNLYALKTEARLADLTQETINSAAGEWRFNTGGPIPSSPALRKDGLIYIGSNDTNFYTISQYANPRNFRDEDQNLGKLLTVEDLDTTVNVSSNTNWLNGSGIRGPWAVRLQVDRSLVGVVNALGDTEYDYKLRLWMRQCNNDLTCDNVMGTWFEDTRLEYEYTAVEDLPMVQEFKLSEAEHLAFDRFFLGFTGAAGAEALDVTISDFQSSFIRPGDSVIECDKNNWPLEDAPDCTQEF